MYRIVTVLRNEGWIDSVISEASRTLYGQTPRKQVELLSDKKFDLILTKIENLATELKPVNISVTQRIDRLDIELERKLTEECHNL